MVDDDAVAQMWSRGDYRIVGDWIADASRSCLDAVDVDGRRVLDLACGTGAVALEAARRGAVVTGIDITPSMLTEARRRAAAEGLDIEWVQGSFTDLTAYRDVDVVTSAFGVMFAEDQAAMAARMLSALHEDGRAVITAWDPEGLLGFPFPGIEELLPPLGPVPDTGRWATLDGLQAILADANTAHPGLRGRLDAVRHDRVVMPFPSVDDAVASMRRLASGWLMLFEMLEQQGTAAAGEQALAEHFQRFSRTTEDGVELAAAYTVATFVRAEDPAETSSPTG